MYSFLQSGPEREQQVMDMKVSSGQSVYPLELLRRVQSHSKVRHKSKSYESNIRSSPIFRRADEILRVFHSKTKHNLIFMTKNFASLEWKFVVRCPVNVAQRQNVTRGREVRNSLGQLIFPSDKGINRHCQVSQFAGSNKPISQEMSALRLRAS